MNILVNFCPELELFFILHLYDLLQLFLLFFPYFFEVLLVASTSRMEVLQYFFPTFLVLLLFLFLDIFMEVELLLLAVTFPCLCLNKFNSLPFPSNTHLVERGTKFHEIISGDAL